MAHEASSPTHCRLFTERPRARERDAVEDAPMFATVAADFPTALAERHHWIDRCAAEGVAELPDAALAEDLVELRRAEDRLEAEFARRLAVFDRRKGCRLDGAMRDAERSTSAR